MSYFSQTTYEDEHDKVGCFAKIKSILMGCSSPKKIIITDNSTGELLFVFEQGNVEYMQGEFAERFLKWAME